MKPIDFRNQTFADLKGQLVLKREAVWLDWMAHEVEAQVASHGEAYPGATTREVCQRFGRDILHFRPRCTELYQMGVLLLVNHSERAEKVRDSHGAVRALIISPCSPREGRYRLRSIPEWEQWFNEQRAEAISGQQQLL